MSLTIILMILGACAFIAGFVVPEKKRNLAEEDLKLGEERIREIADAQIKDVKEKISDMVDETISYAVEKAERSMERVSNEKIMAIEEYSGTVLESIDKNHKEVVFLYDMLNDKHKDLTDTAAIVDKTTKEAKKSVEETAKAAEESAKAAEESAKAAEEAKTAATESKGFAPFGGIEIQPIAKDERIIEAVPMPEILPEVEVADMPELPEEPEFGPDAAIAELTGMAMEPIQELEKPAPKKAKATKKSAAVKAEEPKAAKSKGVAKKPAGAMERSEINLSFSSKKAGAKNNNDEILALHKEGKSNMAIAKELGLGIGEVKLVIDLFEGLK
ncbi:MAG: hypothetical protein K5641_03880 [Lachnospiraceae bacterium]|nr:hypothetical protein [Lachnospiraceae bacterium]